MLLKQYALLPILILCGFTVAAQQHPEADSMMRVLRAHREDTSKALLYYAVGEQYETFNVDSAGLLYKEAYQLSNKLNYDVGKLRYPSYISAICNMQGKYVEGLRINLDGLREARKKGAKRSIIAGLFNTANSYLLLEKYDSATAYYLEALPVIQEQHDSTKLSIAYINLSQLYRQTDQMSKSLKAAQDAVAYSKKGGYQYLTAVGALANVLIDLKRYDEAGKYYDEAITLAKELGAYTVLAQTLAGKTEMYWKTRRFAEMKRTGMDFYETATALKNDGLIAQACYCLSYALLLNKEFAAAAPYTRQGIALALRDSNMVVLEKLYRSTSFLELTKGNAATFWDYYDRADSLDAVSMNMIVLRNTQDLESKYKAKEQAADTAAVGHHPTEAFVEWHPDRLADWPAAAGSHCLARLPEPQKAAAARSGAAPAAHSSTGAATATGRYRGGAAGRECRARKAGQRPARRAGRYAERH